MKIYEMTVVGFQIQNAASGRVVFRGFMVRHYEINQRIPFFFWKKRQKAQGGKFVAMHYFLFGLRPRLIEL